MVIRISTKQILHCLLNISKSELNYVEHFIVKKTTIKYVNILS